MTNGNLNCDNQFGINKLVLLKTFKVASSAKKVAHFLEKNNIYVYTEEIKVKYNKSSICVYRIHVLESVCDEAMKLFKLYSIGK